MYENLLEPIALGPTQIANRVFNPPHGTTLGRSGLVTEDFIAYHEARARGGRRSDYSRGHVFSPEL